MELGLKGKVAAVTASSLGLGQAIAMELAHEGAKVGICARRQGPLDETRAAIGKTSSASFRAPLTASGGWTSS